MCFFISLFIFILQFNLFMIVLLYIAIALIGAAVGIGILMAVQKSTGRSRAKTIVEDAQREAEVIMKDKLLATVSRSCA